MKQTWKTLVKQVVLDSHMAIDEPMSQHTTFRIGGPADIFVNPTIEELKALLTLCKKENIPYHIIGNGSNLLVGDKGIRGVVISIGSQMSKISIKDTHIIAQAGAMLVKTANTALEHSLTGMEFASGIPGTVGGAVVMNAGAYGGEIKDILLTATVLTEDGISTLQNEDLDLSYRHSAILDTNHIVLEAVFELQQGKKDEIERTMADLREKRTQKQPLNYPSAGSTFKRPEGHFAGKLIMDAGLRGYRVGDAVVSSKHCGFVINEGNASAAQVRQLMEDVKQEVYKQFHVVLEPEVRMIGEF